MKKTSYYGLAVLCFLIVMLLFNAGAFLLSSGAVLAGTILGGRDGLEIASTFLMEHLNLYSVLLYMITGTVIFLWYYFSVISKNGVGAYLDKQTTRINPVSFLWIVLLALSVQHITSIILSLIGIILPSALESYVELIESSGATDYSFLWIISTIVLPPLVEETAFRGLILNYLKKAGAGFFTANLIQAALFGVFHMNLVQGIYAALLGFLLGYLAYRYESIFMPILLHGLFNLFGTVLSEIENRFLPTPLFGMLVVCSVPLFVFIFVMIHFGIGEKK